MDVNGLKESTYPDVAMRSVLASAEEDGVAASATEAAPWGWAWAAPTGRAVSAAATASVNARFRRTRGRVDIAVPFGTRPDRPGRSWLQ